MSQPHTPPYAAIVTGRYETCPECHDSFEVDAAGNFITHRIAYAGEPCSTDIAPSDSLTTTQDPVEQRLIDLAIDRLTGADREELAIDPALAEEFGLTDGDQVVLAHLGEVLRRIADEITAEALARLHNDLEQPPTVVHAVSRYQRWLGRLGIATRAYCGKRIVPGDASGPTRECRECRRAVDGER